MTMKKILKEWRTFQNLNEASYGELDKLGINIFLRNFADSHNVDKQKAMYDWSIANMPSDIEEGSEEWSKLKNGYSYNWLEVAGKHMAAKNIWKQVTLWRDDLWSEILSGNADAKREMMFFAAYLDKFMDEEVQERGSRADIDYQSQSAGLGGLMDDWFLGRGGYGYFKKSMEKAMDELMRRRQELKAKK